MAKSNISEELVLKALRQVQEPELHKDLVTLNMIRNIDIQGGKVSFTVVLTTPACPLKSKIEREAREAVEELPGVVSVDVKLDANVPSDGRSRGLLDLPIRNAIAIGSQGRVGKTTVAALGCLPQSGASWVVGCRYLWAKHSYNDGRRSSAASEK
jgi:ATP-binding protein involved in chromosome partitioning